MFKRCILLPLLLIFLSSLAFAGTDTLTILYTGDINGKIKPQKK
jgi:hypothetical protein